MLKDFSGGRIEYSRERGFWEVDPDALDSYGRKVPARPAKRDNATSTEYEFVRCWDESLVIKVKIIDTFPCDYEYGTQEICCGPVPHFDLSFYAFEKLAHPIQGKMNIEFRPVSCGEDSRRLDVDLGARARVEAKIVVAARRGFARRASRRVDDGYLWRGNQSVHLKAGVRPSVARL